jgi:phosphatidylglycerophosphate synthase
MKGEYLYSLIGLAIHHFYCLIDAVDGELARYKKVTSDKGVYLDLIVHIIINPLLIMGMAIGSYLNNPLPIPDISFLIAGFLGSYALLFMNFARIKKYELFVKKGDFKKLKEINKKHVLGNYNLFKKEVFFLIGFEIFNLMFIFVILNLVPYLVLIYAFVFTVLAIIKFIYNYRDIERII